jgi:hypothetical protein
VPFVVALYEASGVHDFELLDVSTDPELTREFAMRMLRKPTTPDPKTARARIDEARREALRSVARETNQEEE